MAKRLQKKTLLIGLSISLCLAMLLTYSIGSTNDSPIGVGVYSMPVWSPDGSYLTFAFRNTEDVDFQLWLFEKQNNKFRRLTIDGNVWQYSGLSWQDNHTLWYILNLGYDLNNGYSQGSLNKIDVVSGMTSHIVDFTSTWQGFSFNPTKNNFTFSREIKISDSSTTLILSVFDVNNQTILDLEPEKMLAPSESSPLWSSNGKYLAFQAGYGIGVGNKIGILEKNGQKRTLDAPVASGVGQFSWLSDNQRILFLGRYDNPGLYVISVDPQSEAKLVLGGQISYLSASPDGSNIAFTALGVPGQNELHIMDLSELDVLTADK